MRHQNYFLFGFHIFFYKICHFPDIEALAGKNVRSADENEFSFIVAILKVQDISYNNLEPKYFCAGTLISKNDILTSDHCLSTEIINGIRILIGSSYLNSGNIYYPEWWQSYDQWALFNNIYPRDHNFNDIALLNLFERVPDNIVPANIWISSFESLFGMETKVAGWGLLQNDSLPNALQVGTVNILSQTECEQRVLHLIGRHLQGDNKTICTFSNPYVLIRRGDSGGPLFFFNFIVGINYGTTPLRNQPIHPSKVNLHVHVSYYYNFISDLRDYY